MATNNKKNTNRINTYEIGKKLHKHLAERAKIEAEQDRLWADIKKRHINRSAEMDKVDGRIGRNTYAIDKLIGQLIKAGCRSGRAHEMAVGYLKREIARNQRIVAKWERIIREVNRRESRLIDASGVHSYDTTSSKAYVAKKKRKIAECQQRLVQLTRAAA